MPTKLGLARLTYPLDLVLGFVMILSQVISKVRIVRAEPVVNLIRIQFVGFSLAAKSQRHSVACCR
jgi:hypothetical protein